MKIAVLLNAAGHTSVVQDTIEAIRYWVTDSILLLVDGAAWESWGQHVDFGVPKLEGLHHNYHKAPYRNMTLGLKTIREMYPHADWYCYAEYDVLFASNSFQYHLEEAEKQKIWMVGNDHRARMTEIPLFDVIAKAKLREYHYLLGCCGFLYKDFMNELRSLDFFDRLLHLTNGFSEGFFPGFTDYDFGEYIFPTMAKHLGGEVGEFAAWEESRQTWRGNFEQFPLRWMPEIEFDCPHAAILHPIKSVEHPLRQTHRARRIGIGPGAGLSS